MRILAVLAVVLVGFGQAASVPLVAPAADPMTCTGYPQARVMLESQAWWRKAGLSVPSQVGEHIHAAACWPVYGSIVSGTLHVDLIITIHRGDDATHHFLERMRVNWRPVGTESGGGVLLDNTGDWDIPLNANGDGTRIFGLNLNLSSMGSATRRFRFNPMAGVDPNKLFPAPEWWACVNKCTVTAANLETVGKGWYSGHEYQNQNFTSPIPTSPVSGTYCFTANINPGGGGKSTVYHAIAVDPFYHQGDPGRVLRQGGGSFSGQTCVNTTTLSDGAHRLVLLGHDGQLAGTNVISLPTNN